MKALLAGVTKFLRDEDGVTAIEYGVLASLIILAVVATVVLVGEKLENVFNRIQKCLASPSAGNCS